jgi:DNA repair protein RecO (recombination protein O)
MSFSWKSVRAEGFIIKRKNFGEADRMITVFTKSQGKIIAVAKGVRKIKSRKSPHVELLNKVSISLSETKSLPILIEADSINNYQILKMSLEKMAYAYKLLEVIDRLCPEKEIHASIYYLLEKSLDQLNLKKSAFCKGDSRTVLFINAS